MKKIFVFLAISILISACTPATVVIPTTAKVPAPSVASRCMPASAAQLAGINDGVKSTAASNSIKTGWAVQSNDFKSVYMVAARIYGPGMSGDNIGVWAISGTPSNPGMILSVDGFAQSFSPYPDASKTSAGITRDADGVADARQCAEQEK